MTTDDLSPADRTFVATLTERQFGSIVGLKFVDGDPVSPTPDQILDDYTFGTEEPPPPRTSDDFTLKKHFVQFFARFRALRNCTIGKLHFRNGLPIRAEAVRRDPPSE